MHYKKKDERGIEGVPELEWELSHHTYTPSIVEPLETPIIVLPHTDRRPEKAWHMAFPTSMSHLRIHIIIQVSYTNFRTCNNSLHSSENGWKIGT